MLEGETWQKRVDKRTNRGTMEAQSEGNVEADSRTTSYDQCSLPLEDISTERGVWRNAGEFGARRSHRSTTTTGTGRGLGAVEAAEDAPRFRCPGGVLAEDLHA